MEAGRHVGFLEDPVHSLVYLIALNCKYISYDCHSKRVTCEKCLDGNLRYEITVPRAADFLEAIKFPVNVVDLEITNGDMCFFSSKGVFGAQVLYSLEDRAISSLSFVEPVPHHGYSLNISYRIDLAQLREEVPQFVGAEYFGHPTFVVRMVSPEDRVFCTDDEELHRRIKNCIVN